jgi:D-arginine dehydrogenase
MSMQFDVVIVGAGFAGAATALHLSRSFPGSILIIDKEEVPGFHASGRNASLLLQSCAEPEIRMALARSRRYYQDIRERIGFVQNGSLLLGKREYLEEVRETDLIQSEFICPSEARNRIPLLSEHSFEAALLTPSDGVIDIASLLQLYLHSAQTRGVQLQLGCRLLSVSRAPRFTLETTLGSIETTFLINAAGAWAAQVAALAGASSLPLVPFKRHLFVLSSGGTALPAGPFVWSLERNFYFRNESGGLLFSICDEEPSVNLEPTVNPGITEALADFIFAELPPLQESGQKKVWSCFRTKTPDGHFVIGWDRQLDNFFWVAGLGGHGMGASWAIGEDAARTFLQPERIAGYFNPSRFFEPRDSRQP